MANKDVKIKFENELDPYIFANFLERVISINLKNNYTPEQQIEILDKLVEAKFIKG